MGNILEFPSQQAQGLAYLERQLRALLEARGADAQLVAFATEQLIDMYAQLSESEQYSFTVELPPSTSVSEKVAIYDQINEGLEGIRQENHSLMVKLVAQLVLAELRLFQHERT